MYFYLRVGLFILICSQLKAQTIPTNPAVRVSYDAEITTYRQVPENTDLNLLTDFEKITFKTRTEQRHYDYYLTQQNEPVTVISYGSRTGYDGTTPDPVVKLIIDKNGTYGYNSGSQLVDNQPMSDAEKQANASANENFTPSNFFRTPEFSDFTSTVLQSLESKGYQVSSTASSLSFKNSNLEFSYDLNKNVIENKIFKGGNLIWASQKFLKRDPQNKLIPSLIIEKNYETSQTGVLIENVKVQVIRNYSRTENRS